MRRTLLVCNSGDWTTSWTKHSVFVWWYAHYYIEFRVRGLFFSKSEAEENRQWGRIVCEVARVDSLIEVAKNWKGRLKVDRRETIIKKRNVSITWCSQAVTHPSTNHARRCLTSVIGRELVFSTWYERSRRNEFGMHHIATVHYKRFSQVKIGTKQRRLACHPVARKK